MIIFSIIIIFALVSFIILLYNKKDQVEEKYQDNLSNTINFSKEYQDNLDTLQKEINESKNEQKYQNVSSHRVYKNIYEYLLDTDEWRNKRQKILARDNYCCRWCGKKTNLNIHHMYYNAYPNGRMVNPWEYPDNALITLCKDCHVKAHQKYKIKTYHIRYDYKIT